MLRSVSNGDEGRSGGGGRQSFQDTMQRAGGNAQRGGQAQSSGFSSPNQQQADQLKSLISAFLDILRALSDRFGGGKSGGETPMPVEPGGGIGDGAGPIPIDSAPMPVEPDGGIGDGAGPLPPEATTLAIGEEDGGIDFGPFPVDPDDGKPPQATTLAIGEEDGGGMIPVEPDGGIGDGAGPPPFIVDGEERFPVEPDGGIGDGAGPPPFIVDGEERFPVEPDGGIGDGAGPPEVTTLALGEEDGGFGPDPLVNVQELPECSIPFNDIAQYGRRSD